MKISPRLILSFVASLLAFAPVTFAQIVTSTNTYSGYSSAVITFSSFGGSLYQTFGNVSAIQSMTFNFFATSTPSNASSFTATIGEWTGSGLLAGTTVSLANIEVDATSAWTTQTVGVFNGFTSEKTLNLAAVLDPLIHPTYGYLTDITKSYAMVISQVSGPNTIGLGANFTNPLQTSLVGFDGATNLGNADWVFSQMSVYAGDQPLVPIPETSTVAAIAGAVMVAGLVIVRTRQRRQLAAVAADSADSASLAS